ncbi:hypothetical protein MES5069_900017 [Mesorhizobium escarrei]|uniref:Uncharacterized protein n=1 Tax=Mesorhizobium escarrei TaxID=666018 RepID=A0ABM9EJN4_9HYPH|nr:hypothetical protein MES5069_900017 [Mesorhizobium escarrei]
MAERSARFRKRVLAQTLENRSVSRPFSRAEGVEESLVTLVGQGLVPTIHKSVRLRIHSAIFENPLHLDDTRFRSSTNR